MGRKATGNVVRHGGKWYARIAIAPGKRPAVHLETIGPDDEAGARVRAALMADVIAELRKAGRDKFIPDALKKPATLSGSKLSAFVKLARGYAAGTEYRRDGVGEKNQITFPKNSPNAGRAAISPANFLRT